MNKHAQLDTKFLAETRAQLAKYATAPSIGNSVGDYEREHPMKPCPTCKGSGVETWTGPHAGSCSGCRGLRRVEMTVEEVRRAYRGIRDNMCARLGMMPETFDQLVRLSLPEDASPGRWLGEARELARRGRSK